MTKDEILELCSSIKRLNILKEGGFETNFPDPSFSPCEFDTKDLEARIDELWEVYCGE